MGSLWIAGDRGCSDTVRFGPKATRPHTQRPSGNLVVGISPVAPNPYVNVYECGNRMTRDAALRAGGDGSETPFGENLPRRTV